MINKAAEKAGRAIAKKYSIPEDLFCAIIEKESAGRFFWTVQGQQVPAIRPEAHYFYRALKGNSADLKAAVNKGLASVKPNYNVPGQPSKIYELFQRMTDINPEAAAYAISMGAGQVMGAHWKRLGFTSALDMWRAAQTGVQGQLDIMARFITSDPKLFDAFKKRNVTEIARMYNGAAYKRNKYDEHIREYAIKYAETTPVPFKKTALAVAGAGGGGIGITGTIVGSSQDAQEFLWGISPITDTVAAISDNAATIVGAATGLVILAVIMIGVWKWARS